MSLFGLFSVSEEEKKLRKLLKDHPNPHIHVVGDGTIRLDPRKIRESAEYKQFSKEMKQFAEG